MSDKRYEYVTCAKCTREFQRIDFYGAAHLLTCPRPVVREITADEAYRARPDYLSRVPEAC